MISLAVIVAIVGVFVLLTRSANHPRARASGRSVTVGPRGDKRYAADSNKLIFGMTRGQVLRLVGSPTKSVGSCWQYRLDELVSEFGKSTTDDAERVCFYGGHYADQYTHSQGKWFDSNGKAVPSPTQ